MLCERAARDAIQIVPGGSFKLPVALAVGRSHIRAHGTDPSGLFRVFRVFRAGFFGRSPCAPRLRSLPFSVGWRSWLALLVGALGWRSWLALLAGALGWRRWLAPLVGAVGWRRWLAPCPAQRE